MSKNLEFKIPPYKHQLKAIIASEEWQDMALWWEMGTGKTKAAIEILRLKYWKENRVKRTLILSPLITLQNWKNEFLIHSDISEKDIHVLNKAGKKRKEFLKEFNRDGIIIINYEALVTTDIAGYLLKWKPEILVCDEAHLLKNGQAKRTKIVEKIARPCDHRYLLSGTPILNSAIDLFSPYKILDGGQTFGRNFLAYRSTYFYDENAAWVGRHNYFPKWIERSDMFPALNKKLYSKALRATKDECLDLPPLIRKCVEVEMSNEQRKIYCELERDFVSFLNENDHIVAQLAITKSMKMRQVISGFAITSDSRTIPFDKNPRLDALEQLLEQSTQESKVVVWACFKQDHKIIGQMLKDKFKWKEGVQYVFLTGEQSESQKNDNMNLFRSNGDCRVIVASQQAGGIGVNLVEANTMIYYSRTFSLGQDKQSEARCHRGGSQQHKSILRIDLVTKGTVDELVMDALQNKQDVANAIIDKFGGRNGTGKTRSNGTGLQGIAETL